MRRAIELAQLGRYTTHPNPRVGCVIARDERIVGEGWHRKSGEAHAEALALAAAGEARAAQPRTSRSSRIAISSRTPPCTDALIRAGVQTCRLRHARSESEGERRRRQAARRERHRSRDGLARSGSARAQSRFREAHDARAAARHRQDRDEPRRSRCAGEWRQQVDHGRARARRRAASARRRERGADGNRNGACRRSAAQRARSVDRAAGPPAAARRARYAAAHCACSAHARACRATRWSSPLREKLAQARRTAAGGRGSGRCGAGCATGMSICRTCSRELGRRECNDVLVEAGPTLAGRFLQLGLADELIVYIAPIVLGPEARAMALLPPLYRIEDVLRYTLHDMQRIGDGCQADVCALESALKPDLQPHVHRNRSSHRRSARGHAARR